MPNNTTENATALALVVIANWFLAHLSTDWVMPSEVQSSLQALIVAGFGWYLQNRASKAITSTIPVTVDNPPAMQIQPVAAPAAQPEAHQEIPHA